MERELLQAQDRWRDQIRVAEKSAEEMKAENHRLKRDHSERLKTLQAEVDRANAAAQESKTIERRLRLECDDMEKELLSHQ